MRSSTCEGVVSHAGLVLLRRLADKSGLTGGLSGALASEQLLVHDRGRVLAELACAIADDSEVISDFRCWLTRRREKELRNRTSRDSAIIRCCPIVTTRASRWPG